MTEKKLTAGVHQGVDFPTYLAQCAPGPVVQATDLRRLHERCPAWAFARWSGNPAKVEDGDSDATAFGKAAHAYLIEGATVFHARYAVKPAGLNLSTKVGIAWKAEHEGRERIDAEDYDAIQAMARMIAAHSMARLALRDGLPEATAVVQDKETGLWMKCRPDYLTTRLAVNLKTTADNGADAFARQAWSLGYHIGAAMTSDILAALGRPVPYAFLCVEKSAPYIPAVRALSDRFLLAGRLIYRRALRRWADCLSSNRWPGYSDGVEVMSLMPWADKEVDNLIETSEQKDLAA